MVKKLFKHEFKAWLRIAPIIFGITLAISAMLRLVVAFETDSVYYRIVLISGIVMFGIAMITTLATPTVFSIVRFYRNLFSGEGYLTHTLPVTAANHLWVKLVVSVVFDVTAVLVLLISGMIATAGEVFVEICKAIAYICGNVPAEMVGHLTGWIAEWTVLLLVAMTFVHLLFYLCICVGQLSKKNRKLAAVGMYFGLYVLTQIVGTIAIVVFTILSANGALDNIVLWISDHELTATHLLWSGLSVVYALLGAAYWGICHHIIRKKLNLE